MKATLILELKKNAQDRGLLFWMIILPIAFTVLFISVFTSGVPDADRETVILSIVPGYTVMFVFFIMISMVNTFLKDRDVGMTARIASTSLSPTKYLLGKWLPYMFIVWIQIFILLAFGKLVYQVPLEQPLYLLITSAVLAFSATGIGLALSMLVHTENMGIALTQVFALGGAVLSGLWMPLEMMPDFMRIIAHGLPQYWAHQELQDAMNGTLKLSLFAKATAVVFAYGCIGFLIAFMRYPHFLKKARG